MVETILPSPHLVKIRKRAGGYVMVMFCLITVVLIAFGSLAVDYGHCKLVKDELQRCADATAHDYIVLYNIGGKSYANTNGPASYGATYNPVDTCAAVTPTVTVTWGYWNPTTQTFSATTVSNYVAVQVSASYTAAKGNAIPLVFARMIGQATCNISVSSTAALMGGSANDGSVNVSANDNPYFSGMPAGTTNQFGDTMTAQGPYQVQSVPVVPGTYITFTNVAGTTSVVDGTVPYVGPNGWTTTTAAAIEHNESYDGTMYGPGPENGIANAIMPDSSFMGLFLGANAPDTVTASSTVVNWTQSSVVDQNSFTNLSTQQPFFIGNGLNGTTVKQFLVPAGATRLYLGVWDGAEYWNNGGALTATVTVQPYVSIVQ